MISDKQRKILAFPYSRYDALICDGAVRSGKTSIMAVSFILWIMEEFDGKAFAWCGKSVGAVERNIVHPVLGTVWLNERYELKYNRGAHTLTVRQGRRMNTIYLFGGRDESSYTLIQGITLAGVLLDEVELMPRSFVEQALARCSVAGSKLWFNCNPENPRHWFNEEWIKCPSQHNALHLHFLMDDNPALSDEIRERYRSMYSGVFYQRYILGRWVISEGVIYDMFNADTHTYKDRDPGLPYRATRYIACDYGTTNPCVFLDIYDDGEKVWVEREYRWDSRKKQRQKTDAEYVHDLLEFQGDQPAVVIVDPSAASFIAALRQAGVYVVAGDNAVADGIRRTATLFTTGRLFIHESCGGLIGELGSYVWDDKAAAHGEERPIKADDHAPDALRYFVNNLPDWRFE